MKVSGSDVREGHEETGLHGSRKDHDGPKRLYPDLYRLTVGYLFGEIWNRPHLSQRDRQIITPLATNVALARVTGSHNHYRSARRLGITHAGDHGSDHSGRDVFGLGLHVACGASEYSEVIEADGLSIDHGDGAKLKPDAARRRGPAHKQAPRKRARRAAKKGKR